MKDAAAVLVPPFKEIWESLAAQTTSWAATMAALNAAVNLPSRLDVIHKALAVSLGDAGKLPVVFDVLMKESQARAEKTREVLSSNFDSFVYPLLVGSWSVVEAAIEDLALVIVKEEPKTRDPAVMQKVKNQLGIDDESNDEFLAAVVGRMQQKHQVKGSVVASHASFLGALGVPFTYPADHSGLIEEINQVRNCILHRQGRIDARACEYAPRLKEHLGKRIPATDPIFSVCSTMLTDYTFHWLRALVFSPYLNAALKPEIRKSLGL